MQFNSRVLLQVKLNSSKMFRHEGKLTLVPVKTFLKNFANIITAFKTGFTVSENHRARVNYMFHQALHMLSLVEMQLIYFTSSGLSAHTNWIDNF